MKGSGKLACLNKGRNKKEFVMESRTRTADSAIFDRLICQQWTPQSDQFPTTTLLSIYIQLLSFCKT